MHALGSVVWRYISRGNSVLFEYYGVIEILQDQHTNKSLNLTVECFINLTCISCSAFNVTYSEKHSPHAQMDRIHNIVEIQFLWCFHDPSKIVDSAELLVE